MNVLWGDVHMTQVFTAHLREHDHALSSSSSRSKRTMGGRQNYIGDRSEHHERYGADTDSRAVLLLTPYSLLTRTCRDSDEPNGWRAPLRPDTQTHEHAHVHAAAAHVTMRDTAQIQTHAHMRTRRDMDEPNRWSTLLRL